MSDLLAQGGGFQAQQVLPGVTDRPSDVIAADLDGDGVLDVLSASVTDDKLAWYKNLGGGTFGPQQVISTAVLDPRSLAAADLDGDGDADIVSGHSGGIQLLANLGGGTFAPSAPLSSQTVGAYALCVADLDGDGDLDVVAVGLGEGKVACYENLGGLAFGPQQDLATGLNSAVGLDVADMDGDGDLDVLFCGFAQVGWVQNLGAWTFGATQTIASDSTPYKGVGAADLDGDGDVDVFSISSDTPHQTGWNEGLGNGAFAPRQNVAGGDIGGPRDLEIGDADGDGDLDVFVIGSSPWNQVSWIESAGGSFALQPIEINNSQSVLGGVAIDAADVDGDGAVDVLTASVFDDKISLYRNWPTVSTYGPGCGAPAANLAPTSAQGIGVPLSARVVGAWPAVVALGLSRTTAGGAALPFDLSGVGMSGCWLLQSTDVFGLATTPSPNPLLGLIWTGASFPPSANGVQVYAQAFGLSAAANALGVVASNGIAWTVRP
jgi:hypothetical protein